MSPVFAHGHLRLYLLVLLSERPMHGYELIQALGERFGGTYVPSAGTVYPRLAKLETEGLVTSSSDGRKTVYAITEDGRAELAAREDEVADVEAGVADTVRSLADGVRASVSEAMKSLRAELAASAQHAKTGRPATETTTIPESARALREAEMLLTTFRQDIHGALRRKATRGTLDSATVQRLHAALDDVRRIVEQE
ncbi:PadR family transcriptional regulator [Curtobacterium ammoniigenes]|uniref:PadR family transcriptional regulator n=1 Tax=Curtobacterium ammoniigenes TaxID=395387 RepID=UPI00082CE411|nr:PadR family transcriptional regulator [Curtobacterium ammoniigenes]